MEKTFAQLLCQHCEVSPEAYAEIMFRRCLYRHARLFRPFLRSLMDDYFDADAELILGVGSLRRAEDLDDEIAAFFSCRCGRSFLRRVLRLRLSTRRVRDLVYTLMPGTAGLRDAYFGRRRRGSRQPWPRAPRWPQP